MEALEIFFTSDWFQLFATGFTLTSLGCFTGAWVQNRINKRRISGLEAQLAFAEAIVEFSGKVMKDAVARQLKGGRMTVSTVDLDDLPDEVADTIREDFDLDGKKTKH